ANQRCAPGYTESGASRPESSRRTFMSDTARLSSATVRKTLYDPRTLQIGDGVNNPKPLSAREAALFISVGPIDGWRALPYTDISLHGVIILLLGLLPIELLNSAMVDLTALLDSTDLTAIRSWESAGAPRATSYFQ